MAREVMKPEEIACGRHGSGEVWIICIHTTAIEFARVHSEKLDGVTGEAVCSECRKALDQKIPERVKEFLRMACGGCVRARWKISNAS